MSSLRLERLHHPTKNIAHGNADAREDDEMYNQYRRCPRKV